MFLGLKFQANRILKVSTVIKVFTRRLVHFFYRLQWKLTLAYALSTVLTTLILGIIGLALLWYINFKSDLVPNLIGDGLVKATPLLKPYLAQSPPDQSGLNAWLGQVTPGNSLIITLPNEETETKDDALPAQFGRVIQVTIVDSQGKVLATHPPGTITPGAGLQASLTSPAAERLQVALSGTTEPALLAFRDLEGQIIAAAPILDDNKQVLGAIYTVLAYPIGEFEFVQQILKGTILPVAGAMLVFGLIAGVIFGWFIARSLTRRLRTLAGAADSWSRGDFLMLAQDTSGDELGQLARHLNHMALQLQNLLQTHQELAALEERNRLARDLHDSVKQQVFATVMQVGAARALLLTNPATAQIHLTEADQLVRQAQQELTTLIQELRPAALEGKGLAAALRDYVANWSRQANITAEVRVRGERSLLLPIEQALFRVVQESLANISRHSRATNVEVNLVWEGDDFTLIVADNGQGFNIAAPNSKGIGLRSMRERLEALGGTLTVDSQIGAGTRVIACCRSIAH